MAQRSPRECLVLALVLAGCTRVNPAYNAGGTRGGSGGQTSGGTGGSSTLGEGDGVTSEGDADADSNAAGSGTDDPCGDDNGGCSDEAQCEPSPGGEVTCICPELGDYDNGDACVAPSLGPLRVEMPCLPDIPQCSSERYLCAMDEMDADEAFLAGDPDVDYRVTLSVTGIVEETSYFMGMPVEWYYEGGESSVPFRVVYRLASEEIPEEHLFLNPGSASGTECIVLDEQILVLRLPGESELVLTAENGSECGIRGGDQLVSGQMPPLDGQFMEIDVVSIELAD